MAITFKSCSAEQTTEFGRRIAAHLFPGAFIALHGELGAGKTALAHGIGEGLGVYDVASPTFTIVQAHEGRLPLFHFDAYRLRDEQELHDIGFSEYLLSGGVILMEWTEHVPSIVPRERLDIFIVGSADIPRSISIEPTGARYDALVQLILSKMGGKAPC